MFGIYNVFRLVWRKRKLVVNYHVDFLCREPCISMSGEEVLRIWIRMPKHMVLDDGQEILFSLCHDAVRL
jgi:hypothetical protein